MSEKYIIHPSPDVQQAIIRLCDALCTWERNTGRQSALVLREEGGFIHRSMNGKPDVPDDVSDELLFATVGDLPSE